MNGKSVVLIGCLILIAAIATTTGENAMNHRQLTPEEERVIVGKGTEPPFTGTFVAHAETGTYVCRRCAAPLYRSTDKFPSHCGWPSFDDEIPGAVKRLTDADGRRTEILCAACDGHLGHVFLGEGFTPKNVRHCVNSLSLDFIPAPTAPTTEKAFFAGGCFWGVEHHLAEVPGVLETSVGYMGGTTKNPTYRAVCSHGTGHAEVVEVVFDPGRTTFEELARLFFEIHDPTQTDRQGPDIGDQYRSEIFVTSPAQRETAQRLIRILEEAGFAVATRISPAADYWLGEEYHQDYFKTQGTTSVCHVRVKRFPAPAHPNDRK